MLTSDPGDRECDFDLIMIENALASRNIRRAALLLCLQFSRLPPKMGQAPRVSADARVTSNHKKLSQTAAKCIFFLPLYLRLITLHQDQKGLGRSLSLGLSAKAMVGTPGKP